MGNIRDFRPSTAAFASRSPTSLWVRLGAVIKAAWTRKPTQTTIRPEAPAGLRTLQVPVTGKLTTISAVATPGLPHRKAALQTALSLASASLAAGSLRRPGLRTRWKASDRVAIS